MEDVAAFKARAEHWLADHKPRRVPVTETPKVWGEGDFDVTVFHDRSLANEHR